jgi:hypothetical protein
MEALNWTKPLKSKTHLENDPDQTAKPFGHTRLCEKCNVKVVRGAWDARLKSERHLTNHEVEPGKFKKLCEICNLEINAHRWTTYKVVRKM